MNTLTQATKHTYVNTRTTGHVNLYATASHTSHVCVHDSSLESQQRINNGTTSLQFTCCGNNFMCTASSSIVSSKKTLKHNGTVQWWDERVRVETYRQEQERCNRSLSNIVHVASCFGLDVNGFSRRQCFEKIQNSLMDSPAGLF